MTNSLKIIFLCTFLFSSTTNFLQSKPFESTYEPLPAEKILITNASIYDGDGNEYKNTDVLVQDGKIVAIGEDLPAPEDFRIIDATGKWVTPGIIDIHSHMGVYPAPGVRTSSDGNEASRLLEPIERRIREITFLESLPSIHST